MYICNLALFQKLPYIESPVQVFDIECIKSPVWSCAHTQGSKVDEVVHEAVSIFITHLTPARCPEHSRQKRTR